MITVNFFTAKPYFLPGINNDEPNAKNEVLAKPIS
jgi:hypothetical protein